MNKYIIMLLVLSTNVCRANINFIKDFSLQNIDIEKFKNKFSKDFFEKKSWPEQIIYNDKKFDVQYSIENELSNFIKYQLKKYHSDFASVVVIDNNKGEVLAAVDYSRKSKEIGKSLTFSATNPAASVFKVITAADLVENSQLANDTSFVYNGKSTTLYKYQLKNRKNKWTRKTTLKKAFARSNNVVFGKAAINYSNNESLMKMARSFGFNKNPLQFLDVGDSELYRPESKYGLAELASGFNRKTLISPLHGALIASVIANDGVLKKPSIVRKIEDNKSGLLIWKPKESQSRVLSTESANDLKQMMQLTVNKGTARSAFRKRRKKEILIGGKTGSITGGLPFGKRDWFVSYAMPNSDKKDKGISVCVMIVNVKKWYIKSPVLAKNIIEYYYSKVHKVTKL